MTDLVDVSNNFMWRVLWLVPHFARVRTEASHAASMLWIYHDYE